jgi:valyl-tRNA synthetase
VEAAAGYDHRAVEARVRALWEERDVFRYDPAGTGPVFSVDTPPPYVSAAHLHVGHAMSYSQPDFVVRYRRMRGDRIFYPMGFDDNGLPTERYVEQTYGVRARDLPRAEFVALCLAETRRVAAGYAQLWRRLGLSVDWSLRYSTIAPASQRIAQLAFLELYERGHVTRAADPILWCPECRTALAQADVEDLVRTGTLHRISFGELVIATTRPELLPACVALYCHPDDPRYAGLVGGTATVPLAGHNVPIRADAGVDPDFGTGLMMVCTFGDGEDVARWRRDGLDLRLVVTEDGRLGPEAGELAGAPLARARKQIVARLAELGALVDSAPTRQTVGAHERCGTPVEFQIRPQWFIGLRAHAGELRQRARELTWIPEHMRHRLTDWIDGLKWDWNISRQRHYGTPFPVWFCRACATPVLAPREALPTDPLAGPPPVDACPACGGTELSGDPDVMDTWVTSSLSPRINDWSRQPMSLRIQGHEIIRTWLFYSVVQSQLLAGRLPWRSAMISGWGLNEQGKKISKRDLAASDGFNRYVPDDVMDKYGADALRLWATKARVGGDLRYHEKDIRTGRKFAVKIWNVGQFLSRHLGQAQPEPAPPAAVDRWLLSHLADTIGEVTAHLEAYDVMQAHQAASRFFWPIYCDRYLEMVKGRFDEDPDDAAARSTLWRSFRAVLGLFAPFAPFVTEHLYQQWYQPYEQAASLHVTAWPVADPAWRGDRDRIEALVTILDQVRVRRSQLRLGGSARIATLVLHPTTQEAADLLREIAEPLRVAARADKVAYEEATHQSGIPGLTIDLVRCSLPKV